MRLRSGPVAAALLLCCHVCAAAQDAKPPQKQEFQFDPVTNDPCGNPAIESNLWLSVTGKVVKVPAGDRLVIDVPGAGGHKARRGVAVRLVGVEAPAPSEPFGQESRQQLERLALGRDVSVWTQASIAYREAGKRIVFRDELPGEIVGVAHLHSNLHDLNLKQVSAGLARHKDARSNTMSNYRECTYRLAEGEAREAGRGLWRQGGVTK